MAIVLVILLFATNNLRSNLSKSRWCDPVWLAWLAVPLAVLLCKRNPVVDLTYYGFILMNGFMHVGSIIAMGTGLLGNPGGVMGTLFFIPISVWVIYVCLKSNFMPKKGLLISFLCGMAGHIALAGVYAFLPLLLALFLSKILKLNKAIERI